MKNIFYIKSFNPRINSHRFKINVIKNLFIKKNRLVKGLLGPLLKNFGRSKITGKKTIFTKGRGCKKIKRLLLLESFHFIGFVLGIFYDPSRSSLLSLLFNFFSKKFLLILHTLHTGAGSLIYSLLKKGDLKVGCRFTFQQLPSGILIHSLSFNKKITMIRSAGCSGLLIQKNKTVVKLRLPSGKLLTTDTSAVSQLGSMSHKSYKLIRKSKAGYNRLKGKHPQVRGVAMNPIDHPHGGRTKGGIPSVSAWSVPTKGKPTVKFKK